MITEQSRFVIPPRRRILDCFILALLEAENAYLRLGEGLGRGAEDTGAGAAPDCILLSHIALDGDWHGWRDEMLVG